MYQDLYNEQILILLGPFTDTIFEYAKYFFQLTDITWCLSVLITEHF
jgi:hypothetical protein